jgi:hypothetical protein
LIVLSNMLLLSVLLYAVTIEELCHHQAG